MSESARDKLRARVRASVQRGIQERADRAKYPRSVGVVFRVEAPLADRPEHLGAYVDAFLSPAWGKPLKHFTSRSVGGAPFPRKAGSLRKHEVREVLTSLLPQPDLLNVSLWTAAKSLPPFARLSVDTRRAAGGRHVMVEALHWIDPDDDAVAPRWLDAMLALAGQVGAVDGVAIVSDWDAIQRDLSGRGAGPQWGTIWSRARVDAAGGRAAIEREVAPAVVRDLGAAWYFQLTGDPASATSDDAVAWQRAFTAIAART